MKYIHFKQLFAIAILPTVLFTTACSNSYALITSADKTDINSFLSSNNDNYAVFSIRGNDLYADTYDDADFAYIPASTNNDSINDNSDNSNFYNNYDNPDSYNDSNTDNTLYNDYITDDNIANNDITDNNVNDNTTFSDDNDTDSNTNDNIIDNDAIDNNITDNIVTADTTSTDDDILSYNNDSGSNSDYHNPNAWIKELSASSYNNQLIIVSANGSSANVSMYNKNDDNTWETIVNTDGYVGIDGVGRASEYARVTPAGIYSLSIAFGINSNPGTALPYTQVDSSYYWVDDPESALYNRFVTTNNTQPDWSSAEHIIDYPVPYAYAIAIDYNTSCVKGAGSAIFLHCSNHAPTYGCVSVPQSAMITILNNIRPGCSIIIDNSYNISDY